MKTETWYVGSHGEIEEVQVVYETPKKVRVIGRFGSGSRGSYIEKTSIAGYLEWQWCRKDRDEVKRLMVNQYQANVKNALAAYQAQLDLLNWARSL